jgi:hypothetical protein
MWVDEKFWFERNVFCARNGINTILSQFQHFQLIKGNCVVKFKLACLVAIILIAFESAIRLLESNKNQKKNNRAGERANAFFGFLLNSFDEQLFGVKIVSAVRYFCQICFSLSETLYEL